MVQARQLRLCELLFERLWCDGTCFSKTKLYSYSEHCTAKAALDNLTGIALPYSVFAAGKNISLLD